MVKRIVNLPNIQGWQGTAAGAFNAHTVVCDVPIGPRYHVIWIDGNGGAGKYPYDLIGEIRVKLNGKVQRVFTLSELIRLNALNGAAFCGTNGNTQNGYFSIPIWFAEPWRKSVASQDGMAWGTGNDSVSSFTIEMDITAYGAAAAGLVSPVLRAEIDNSLVNIDGRDVPAPIGAICKWYKFAMAQPAATGYTDNTGLPKRDFYQQISLVDTAVTNIADFEVKVDNNIIRQDTRIGNTNRLRAREMNPEPTASADCPARLMVDIVFDHDDLLTSALPTVFDGRRISDLNLRLNNAVATSRNVTAIVQLWGRPD